MSKPITEPIRTERLVLRPIGPGDLETIRSWRNDPENRRWFLDRREITPEAQRAWYAAYLERDDDVMLVMERVGGQEPVGQVALYHIDRTRGEAEVGRVLVDPEHRHRGYAREAVLALVEHAVRHLGLTTLRAVVLPDNAASLALFRSCGFAPGDPRDGLVVMKRQARAAR